MECLLRGRNTPATWQRTRKRTLRVCDEHKGYYERLDWCVANPVVKLPRAPHPPPPPFEPL
jgi:hypothetical protein